KTLVVDGTPIRYIDAGAGPAVVLIHGFAASMYAWRHTIGPLAAAGYRVVAFDDRGFGFSARPATGYANADYVRLVVALLDSLHIPDAVLVGHSMGGEIAGYLPPLAATWPPSCPGPPSCSCPGLDTPPQKNNPKR